MNPRTPHYYSRRRKRGNSNSTSIDSLSDDLLSEILIRVPAEDIHENARIVCRRWKSIVGADAEASTEASIVHRSRLASPPSSSIDYMHWASYLLNAVLTMNVESKAPLAPVERPVKEFEYSYLSTGRNLSLLFVLGSLGVEGRNRRVEKAAGPASTVNPKSNSLVGLNTRGIALRFQSHDRSLLPNLQSR